MDESKNKVTRTSPRPRREEGTPEFAFAAELDAFPEKQAVPPTPAPAPVRAPQPIRPPAPNHPTPPSATPSMNPSPIPDANRPVRRIVRSTVRPTSGLSGNPAPMQARPPSPVEEPSLPTPPLPVPPPDNSRPVVDYRQQVDRQQKEQKSTNSLLATFVYALVALVLSATALAGYGAYVIFGELSDQKATAQQIRNDLADKVGVMGQRLDSMFDSFSEEQARHQEEVLKLHTDIENLAAQLQTATKAHQVELNKRDSTLKSRLAEIKDLQNRINRVERRLDLPAPTPQKSPATN